MKLILCMLSAVLLASACHRDAALGDYDIEIVAVPDNTDSLAWPDIFGLLSLTASARQGLGIRIIFIGLSDVQINHAKVFTLKREEYWNGNPTVREHQIRHFATTIQKYVTGMPLQVKKHSQVYRAFTQALNYLSKSKTARRIMITNSDCLENSQISFYVPRTLEQVKTSPALIEEKFEKEAPLHDLLGIEIYFSNQPRSFEQDTLQQVATSFFATLFKKHNAIIHESIVAASE